MGTRAIITVKQLNGTFNSTLFYYDGFACDIGHILRAGCVSVRLANVFLALGKKEVMTDTPEEAFAELDDFTAFHYLWNGKKWLYKDLDFHNIFQELKKENTK